MSLRVLKDDELMVAHVEGDDEASIDFLDAYMPGRAEFVVVDSGRLIVHTDDLETLVSVAKCRGIEVAS